MPKFVIILLVILVGLLGALGTILLSTSVTQIPQAQLSGVKSALKNVIQNTDSFTRGYIYIFDGQGRLIAVQLCGSRGSGIISMVQKENASAIRIDNCK
ncbi:hypothetical protein HY229_09330 [Candidatus Acetothermia bacterium]|nr:hypothetical protein [Candidatus Acetothermia bacterium]MBI3644284.1 hypothetical protein [Candidatus Acetothermia bacterium]